MKNKNAACSLAQSEAYLEKCVRILSAGAYRMCRDNYRGLDKSQKIDPKLLKETCLAVKETAALIAGIAKKDRDDSEVIRVVFEDTEDCAE